jgi:tripartite-type tricarboxylate transporter receptor subunit TctC
MAIMMPAGCPPAVIARLNRAMRDAIGDAEVAQSLKSQGLEPSVSTPDALRERIGSEITKWRPLVTPAGANASR